jgi:hypothetical protein
MGCFSAKRDNRFFFRSAAIISALFAAPAVAQKPHDVASKNIVMHTDLPDDEARAMLDQFEKLLKQLSTFWGRPPNGTFEIFVVKDLSNWPTETFDATIQDFILKRVASTRTSTDRSVPGTNRRMRIYGAARPEPFQFQLHFAFMSQTFPGTGPVWFRTGMAEVCSHWREDGTVAIGDVWRNYLRNAPNTAMSSVIKVTSSIDNGMEERAPMWCLNYFLLSNPNYASRFRKLALDFMQQRSTTFEKAFADCSREMTFEYKFFIDHLDDGLRADLCALDWKKKAAAATPGATYTIPVEAARGWQMTPLVLRENQAYEYSATGTWKASFDGQDLTADGAPDKRGRLIGALLMTGANGNYEFSESFDLGTSGLFECPLNGRLVVRCQDDWNALGDNQGKIILKLSQQKK